MENRIDSTEKKIILTATIVLMISSVYLLHYWLHFREYSAITYTITYHLIYTYLARPLFYTALFFILGRVLLVLSIIWTLSECFHRQIVGCLSNFGKMKSFEFLRY